MAPETNNDVLKTEELAELLREIRERVRARHPEAGDGAGLTPVADLMPLVHARDAAEAKVAAIGSVNPRPSGPLNALIQVFKRTVARERNALFEDGLRQELMKEGKIKIHTDVMKRLAANYRG